ncbi:MAG: AEC family transporter, partial [Candidatus Micrarchaeota archaeon]|nr:AEC family transporter [Candidatus Micrarchaeota archaeon]
MAPALLVILFFLAGFLLARLGLAKSEHYKPLANVVFYLCLPASLLVSFSQAGSLPFLPPHFAALFGSLLAVAAIAYLASRAFSFDQKTFYALLLCGSFGNVIYFGFPLTQALLGQDALSLAGLYVIGYNVFVFAFLYPLISSRLNGKAGF